MSGCVIDHITITAPSLEAGQRLVEQTLGVSPQVGGEHPRMGTHNLFLHLGDSTFLEIIAANPLATAPERPRWFDLDRLDVSAPAALRAWVLRTDDIQSTLEQSLTTTGFREQPSREQSSRDQVLPDGDTLDLGLIEPMIRGDNHWLITICKDGSLPLQGTAPMLIEWQVDAHPASRLKDHGLSLVELRIYSPAPSTLEQLIHCLCDDSRIKVFKAEQAKIVASIQTPSGLRELSI